MLDIFNDDAFSVQGLTARVNRIPEVPTVIGGLGIFEEDGVDTTLVSVERQDTKLTLIGSSEYGGDGEADEGDGPRDLVPIAIPHFQRDDNIKAIETQNRRAFGTDNELETMEGRVERKMARHTRSLDFTLEYQRLGAITGIIVDKDPNKILLNTFTAFDMAQPGEIDFALATAGTDVRDKCRQVRDGIEDALEGFQVPRVFGLAGDTFFHSLVTHGKVEDTYKNWEASVNLRADPRLPFEFGGISWVRYHTKPKAKAAKGGTPMIADDKCRFVAGGVPELFITRFAPADYEETVNTPGLPRYARQWPRADGKGRHLQVQMNAISLCTIPSSLFRAKRA